MTQPKALLLEGIHHNAEQVFKEAGFQVTSLSGSPDPVTLLHAIKDAIVLGVRSKTQITANLLDNAPHLEAVGAFCIGTNQINLQAATDKGIAVFNAPYSNTRSVVELALAEIILLLRNLPDKMGAMHRGQWQKSAHNAHEARDKVLGIVGYGNIGMQLGVLAEAVGMQVVYYDIEEKLAVGNAQKMCILDELLVQADVVSIHVDGRPENANLFGAEQFKLMKPGAILLNLSRGHVVDMVALQRALSTKHLGGVGIDVFPVEPASNQDPFISNLKGLPNTILTPHIGGSTMEAQEHIGTYVATKLVDYIKTGSTTGSVNMPELQLGPLNGKHRLIHIHRNVPGILAEINNVLAQQGINILRQSLATNDQIGYVATDVETVRSLEPLQVIEHTIRTKLFT